MLFLQTMFDVAYIFSADVMSKIIVITILCWLPFYLLNILFIKKCGLKLMRDYRKIFIFINKYFYILNLEIKLIFRLFIHSEFYNQIWGLGIGDWGLGPIPNPHQSPIPKPQSPLQYISYHIF